MTLKIIFLAAGKAAAALGKTFQGEGEDVRPISNFQHFSVLLMLLLVLVLVLLLMQLLMLLLMLCL